jgi:hypothetical protein
LKEFEFEKSENGVLCRKLEKADKIICILINYTIDTILT